MNIASANNMQRTVLTVLVSRRRHEHRCHYLVTLGDKVLWVTHGRIDIATAADTLARVVNV